MKPSTQTRVDSFLNAGNTINVIGRKNHIISTEQLIKQNFDCELYADFEWDDRFDNYHTSFQTDRVRAHIEPAFDDENDQETDPKNNHILIQDYPINRTLRELQFQPETSTNTLDTKPTDQLALLPYLCEENIRKNMTYRLPSVFEMGADENWLNSDTGLIHDSENFPDDNTNSYVYHPTEQGMFFLRLHKDNDTDTEEDTIFKSMRARQNGNLENTRFKLKTENPAATGLDHLEMFRYRKKIDGVYRNVYRTRLKDYMFKVDARHLSTAATKLQGEYSFSIPYDLEIGPFDKSGFAKLRCVSFVGEMDVSSEHERFGFYSMVLYDQHTGTLGLGITDPGNAPTKISDIVDSGIFKITLYLPIRRFSLGVRDHANNGNPANNHMLEVLDDQYTIDQQVNLMMMINRDELPAFGAEPPINDFQNAYNVPGRVYPLFEENVDDDTRELQGLQITPGSLSEQLANIMDDDSIQDQHVFILTARTEYGVENIDGQQFAKWYQHVGEEHNGWYPNGNNYDPDEAPTVFDGTTIAEFRAVNTGYYIFFPKSAIQLDGEVIYLDEEAKYVFEGGRYINDAVYAALQTADAAQTTSAPYDFAVKYKNTRNVLFRSPTEARDFVDGQVDARYRFDANGDRAEFRLNFSSSNTNYLHSIADVFWDHRKLSTEFEPDYTEQDADLLSAVPYNYVTTAVLSIFQENVAAAIYDEEMLWLILGQFGQQGNLEHLVNGNLVIWSPDYNADYPFDDLNNPFPQAEAVELIEETLQPIQAENYDPHI